MPADHVIERASVGELLRREAGEPRPKALDLFCCAGGASMGLHRAGFDVTGIDRRPQPRYPFRFIQADALHPPVDLSSFDFIWASPPCQAHVRGLKNSPGYGDHVDLIPQTRAMLIDSGVAYCIENVPGAPLNVSIKLGGWMFPELRVIRERWFELSFLCLQPSDPKPAGLLHKGYLSIAGTGVQKWCLDRGYTFNADDARRAMGIDWMSRAELSQAIPPAYAEFIGRAALRYLGFEPRHDRRENFLDRTQSGLADRGCHPVSASDARMSKSRRVHVPEPRRHGCEETYRRLARK